VIEASKAAGGGAGKAVEAATQAHGAVQADMAAEQALIDKLAKQAEQLKAEHNDVAANVVHLQLELERAKLRKLTYQAKALAQGAAAAAAGAKGSTSLGSVTLDDIMSAIRSTLAAKVGDAKPGSAQHPKAATDAKVAQLAASVKQTAAVAKATDKAAGKKAQAAVAKKMLIESEQSETAEQAQEQQQEQEEAAEDTDAALADLEALRGTSSSSLDRDQARLHHKVQRQAEQEAHLSSDEKDLDDILLRWSRNAAQQQDAAGAEEVSSRPRGRRATNRVPLP